MQLATVVTSTLLAGNEEKEVAASVLRDSLPDELRVALASFTVNAGFLRRLHGLRCSNTMNLGFLCQYAE